MTQPTQSKKLLQLMESITGVFHATPSIHLICPHSPRLFSGAICKMTFRLDFSNERISTPRTGDG